MEPNTIEIVLTAMAEKIEDLEQQLRFKEYEKEKLEKRIVELELEKLEKEVV